MQGLVSRTMNLPYTVLDLRYEIMSFLHSAIFFTLFERTIFVVILLVNRLLSDAAGVQNSTHLTKTGGKSL